MRGASYLFVGITNKVHRLFKRKLIIIMKEPSRLILNETDGGTLNYFLQE